MRHLLIVSNDEEWAQDPEGRQWVKRPRERYDPECPNCVTDAFIAAGPDQKLSAACHETCCAFGTPMWFGTYYHPDAGRYVTMVACERHVRTHLPINIS